MLQPPSDVTDADVLEVVRRHWEPAADAVDRTALGGLAEELTRPHFDER